MVAEAGPARLERLRVDWNARIVAPFVGVFVVLAAVVVLAILRLGELTSWPPRWLAFVFLVLLLLPIALVLLSAIAQAERESEPETFLGWISNLLPWL